jgi:hypothetical protein
MTGPITESKRIVGTTAAATIASVLRAARTCARPNMIPMAAAVTPRLRPAATSMTTIWSSIAQSGRTDELRPAPRMIVIPSLSLS